MNILSIHPTVAVVTASIGRPELARTMASVQAQTYPCRHYVFADGAACAEAVFQTASAFPEALVSVLAANTGSDGWLNGPIHAAAPFLTREDIICYLDDDNYYEPEHIADLVTALQNSSADYAYSLRNFIDLNGRFICRDDLESLGEWPCLLHNQAWEIPFSVGTRSFLCQGIIRHSHHIDTNCYALTRHAALAAAPAWYQAAWGNDRNVFQFLQENGFKGSPTGRYTINYALDTCKSQANLYRDLAAYLPGETINEVAETVTRMLCNSHIQVYGGTPWAKI